LSHEVDTWQGRSEIGVMILNFQSYREWRPLGLVVVLLGLGVTLLWFRSSESKGAGILALLSCALGTGLSSWTLYRATANLSILTRIQAKTQNILDADCSPLPLDYTHPALAETILAQLDSCGRLVSQLNLQVEDMQIQAQLSLHQKKNIEDIILSLQDAVVVVDNSDRLLLANHSAMRLFEIDWRTAEREVIGDILPENARELVALIHDGRKNSRDVTRKAITLGSEEDLHSFDCYTSCIHDASVHTSQVLAVLRDVTREKEVAKIKNDFVSYVSHELKTPLASITAYIEMLLDDEAADEAMQQEFYCVIQSQAKRLNRLIENILNVSRIESGLMKIAKESVSLTILVDEQVQMIRGYAEDRSIQIVGQKPIVFDQVYADRDMMAQVIVNLLSNAIKYNSPGGSVTIETEVDESQSAVRVCVHDTGVGIPDDEITHVFDKFYRASSNEDRAEGTGLGLSLVRQIVEKIHGGHVFVKSQVGSGSTFGFELPLVTQQEMKAFA
jgi:signal transduction histidine kinase